MTRNAWTLAVLLLAVPVRAQETPSADAAWLAERYEKREVRIPMRDGVELFTAVYTPREALGPAPWPVLMKRTPYGLHPYGEDAYPERLGPSRLLEERGFVFVLQDVRGRYLSGGEFVNMRPHVAEKDGPEDVDESTDTHDTIEWLLANVEGTSGRVGLWGISYPGFYAAAGMIDAHPALSAVSPQAPIADWYFDDFHHHGAFFLPHAFRFFGSFGRPRPEPTTERNPPFELGTPDGYSYFLDVGPLSEANERHFGGQVAFWDEIVEHPDYDEFWRARDLRPHLQAVAPAVLTVGGWFDAEDLFGPLEIYRYVEDLNPGVFNVIVMGPWRHGGWSRDDGDRLGDARFGSKTSPWYREHVEARFFEHFLRGAEGEPGLAEATVFETGANRWRTFATWPPAETRTRALYLHAGGGLSFEDVRGDEAHFTEWVSDPRRPVPFTQRITPGMPAEYMVEDQRFAARRPDVAVFQTAPLEEDLTLAGPIWAELIVATSGEDADWVVKLIDVFPPDAPDPEGLSDGVHMGEYQMMVRSEVLRGRYRGGYVRPRPFPPDEPTRVAFELQDVLHTFRAGHRVMVHVQNTWFPLVDRNPQKWVDNVFAATEADLQPATMRLFHAPNRHNSHLLIGVLEAE